MCHPRYAKIGRERGYYACRNEKLVPDLPLLIAFLTSVIAIQLSPGPDMMMIIARGVGQGRKVALTCVAGISAASVIQIPALALGVATIFESSALAYTLLKNLGAAYLVYLGIRFLLGASKAGTAAERPIATARSAFFQGFWGNLANPKSLVFLLAFLPQFVDPTRGAVGTQLVVLGAIHKLIGLMVDSSVAILAGTSGNWLRKHPGFAVWQERVVGLVLVSLGLKLAFDSSE